MLSNPRSDRVRSIRGLSRRSARVKSGRFLVDGPQGVREAVRYAAARVDDLYVTQAAAQRYGEVVDAALTSGIPVHECTPEVMAALCDTEAPQGMAALVRDEQPTLQEVIAARPRMLVLLTNVRDPGNAGTVIRGADAAGADAVLVSEASVDVTAPKVVRSTVGSLFHLPVLHGLGIDPTIEALRSAGLRVLAADGAGETLLPDVDLSSPHVWVMGNEAWGLPQQIQSLCDEVVRVPIYGKAESLNLAMAATVCLYASAGIRRHGDGTGS